jgi:DnaJ-class molecular chaperone
MKNYYKVLGVKSSITSDEIKSVTKYLVNKVKSSKLSSDEKNIKLANLKEAYNFLNDYHNRKKLDESLEKRNLIAPTSVENILNKLSLFSNFGMPEILNLKDNGNNKYYQHSSFVTSKRDENGNLITESKTSTNNNGEVKENHKIITKDVDGNEIINDIAIPVKKSIKYKI